MKVTVYQLTNVRYCVVRHKDQALAIKIEDHDNIMFATDSGVLLRIARNNHVMHVSAINRLNVIDPFDNFQIDTNPDWIKHIEQAPINYIVES